MDFIFERLKNKNPDGSLQIMCVSDISQIVSYVDIVHEGTRSMVCLIRCNSQGDSDRPVGGKDLEEIELLHLDGHKGSKPVRFVPPIIYATLVI